MAEGSAPEQTFDDVLREGMRRLAIVDNPKLDSRVLLKAAAGCDDAGLIANGRDPLPPPAQKLFLEMVERRACGEPIAYITGQKEFWSLPFNVTQDVLIPRVDSESLIEAVIARRNRAAALTFIDLGVGSGCLLCALLSEFKAGFGAGVDCSPAAVRIAQNNAAGCGLTDRTVFAVGDWLSAIGQQFDVIVANPPYIRDGDRAGLPRDISAFEPASALDAGPHGFDSYREIFQQVPAALSYDGLLVVEAGDHQSDWLADLARETFPAATVEKVNDLKGFARAIVVDLSGCAP